MPTSGHHLIAGDSILSTCNVKEAGVKTPIREIEIPQIPEPRLGDSDECRVEKTVYRVALNCQHILTGRNASRTSPSKFRRRATDFVQSKIHHSIQNGGGFSLLLNENAEIGQTSPQGRGIPE
jgi:hypothetical protein